MNVTIAEVLTGIVLMFVFCFLPIHLLIKGAIEHEATQIDEWRKNERKKCPRCRGTGKLYQQDLDREVNCICCSGTGIRNEHLKYEEEQWR